MEDSEDYSDIDNKRITESNEESISSLAPTKNELEDESIEHQRNNITDGSEIGLETNDELSKLQSDTNRGKSRLSDVDNDTEIHNEISISETNEKSNIETNDDGIEEPNIDDANTERIDGDLDESDTETKGGEIDDGTTEMSESAMEMRADEIEESNTERVDEELDESATERRDEKIDEGTAEENDNEIEESNTDRKSDEIDLENTERSHEELDESITERRDEEPGASNTERNDEDLEESNTERKSGEIDESSTERKDEEIDESNTEGKSEEIDESNTERKDEEIDESNTERKDEEIDESNIERKSGEIDEMNTERKDEEIDESNKEMKSAEIDGTNIERKNDEFEESSAERKNEGTGEVYTERIDVVISETIKTRKESPNANQNTLEIGITIATNTLITKESMEKMDIDNKGVTASFDEQEYNDNAEHIENIDKKPSIGTQIKPPCEISNFFTAHIQLDDGTVKNQVVTIVRNKGRKPFLGGYRHKLSGIEYHNASVQTRPRPRPPPIVELFSRDTQTFQVRHQKVNTNNTTSTQMTVPGVFVSNATDKLITPGKYETADDYKDRLLGNIITIQKYYRRWLAKHIVENRRKERDERLAWEKHEKDMKMKEKEERIKREYERRMHPKTQADFDLLYNGLERWRQDQLAEINNGDNSEAEKKAAKLLLLDEETDLLAAIDRHKIDRNQQSKSEEVQRLLNKAAAPKTWKDVKGKKIEMDTPYTIRSRELMDILNSLNMQYLTPDERLDVLLTLKHTVKEHDCKLTRDIIELVDREADLIMRSVKDSSLAGLRKRIVTLFLQYCKTPTFNPEISLLLRVPPDPSVLIGDINYCKYCGRYLHSTEFSLSTKSSKLIICKSCARKENQSRKRQDYSHYRRILKDLQVNEQQIDDGSKIAFIFKQNDIKTLMEGVWDNKSIISECEDLDELIFVRWDRKDHWSPWNTVLLTKDESEAHEKVTDLSATYSNVMLNRINQKHVIAKNMFASLEKMIEKVGHNITKLTVKK